MLLRLLPRSSKAEDQAYSLASFSWLLYGGNVITPVPLSPKFFALEISL